MMTRNKILSYIKTQEKCKEAYHQRFMRAINEDNLNKACKHKTYLNLIQERIDTAIKILNG